MVSEELQSTADVDPIRLFEDGGASSGADQSVKKVKEDEDDDEVWKVEDDERSRRSRQSLN